MNTQIRGSIKFWLAFGAGIFCCLAVQAQQPQGIGKPAPVDPPAKAVVQTPEPRVLTVEDRANAAKSMQEYQRTISNGVKPADAEIIRPKQPQDAIDPRKDNSQE